MLREELRTMERPLVPRGSYRATIFVVSSFPLERPKRLPVIMKYTYSPNYGVDRGTNQEESLNLDQKIFQLPSSRETLRFTLSCVYSMNRNKCERMGERPSSI